MKRAALVFIFIPVVCFSTLAQEVGRAEFRYDEHHRMISIFGIIDPTSTPGCTRFVFKGIISAVEYDDNQRIVNFTLKRPKGRHEKIYLLDELYEQGLSKNAAKQLPTLIKKNNHVRVVSFGCGISAAILTADEVTSPN